MSNIRNLDAEIGANYIGDDAQPALSFDNSSTGPGLLVTKFQVTSGATIAGGATAAPAAQFVRTVIGSPTIGALGILTSGASIPALQLGGSGFASLSTIKFTTGGAAGQFAIRVVSDTGVLGWIPVMPDAAVTAVAI